MTLVYQPDIYGKKKTLSFQLTVIVLTQQKYNTIFSLDNKITKNELKCSLYNVCDYIAICWGYRKKQNMDDKSQTR